jgi:hypothetical protein
VLSAKNFSSVRKNILLGTTAWAAVDFTFDGWEAVIPWSAKSIQVPDDPQTFERKVRMNQADLR